MDLSEQNGAECDNLDELDHKIVHFLIERPSISDRELGDELGIGRQTANRRRRSQRVQKRLIEILSLTEKRMRRVSVKAMRRIEDLLDDPNPKIRLDAAKSLIELGPSLMTPTPTEPASVNMVVEGKKCVELWLADES